MIEWLKASRRRQLHLALVTVFAACHIAFQYYYHDWFIEDAAITFTYSRNLVMGEGLVPFIGAERVEGYSNPLWTFIIAAFYAIGIDGFVSSKWLAYGMGGATVFLSWLIAREARDGADDDATLLAPAVLAGTQTFAMYNAGGLENALYGFLLALGIWRTVREARRPQWPLSALIFFGMAITRPEGILYAAFGGFWAMVTTLRAGYGLAPTAKWLGSFWLPFGIYQAWRINYFAWEWPNTYYAKQVERDFNYLKWNTRPWTYTRNGFDELAYGYYTPFYLLGLVGLHRKQWWRTVGLALGGAAMFFVLAYPGTDLMQKWGYPRRVPMPDDFDAIAVVLLCVVGLLLPLAAIGKRGWQALVMCWGMAAIAVFFSVYTGGDWMKGFRWLHIFTVPAAVLMGEGIGVLADLLDAAVHRDSKVRWKGAGWLLALPAMALVPYTHIQQALEWGKNPVTGPYKIKRRVDWEIAKIRRLHLYRPTLMDVDMGAHMYWGVMPIYDYAGLIDVPLAHHQDFSKAFMREYAFEQKKPTFIHTHGGWARKSKLPTHVEFKRDYFELPGYPASPGSRTLHMGNYLRKDSLSKPEWTANRGRIARWANGVNLVGWRAPVADVGAGENLYLEVALHVDEDHVNTALPTGVTFDEPAPELGYTDEELDTLPEDERRTIERDHERELRRWERERDKELEEHDLRAFRVVAVLIGPAGELVQSWEIPPFYDFFPVDGWESDDLFWGRFDLNIPAGAPQGDLSLGFVMFDVDGSVVPATLPEGSTGRIGGTEELPAAFATGEVRFEEAVQVISAQDHAERIDRHRGEVRTLAEDTRCEEAEASWELLRFRLAGQHERIEKTDPGVRAELASCWVQAAEGVEDLQGKAERLARARYHDHRSKALRAARGPVLDVLWAEADAARAAEDWELAFTRYEQILAVDQAQSWARRYAEEARDRRLGLDPFSKAADAARRQLQKEKADESRRVREEARGAAGDD